MSFFKTLGTRQEEKEFDIRVYTGLAKLVPVIVNPTLAQMHDILGMEYVDKEPEYKGENFDKEPVTHITVWCKNEEHGFLVPLRFQISDRIVRQKEGEKVKVINKYGQTSYVTKDQYEQLKNGQKIERLEWLLPEDVRVAFDGEEELINFFRTFKNLYRVGDKTTREELDQAASMFSKEDWQMLISLNPEMLSAFNEMFKEKHPESGESYTVVYLLGARTNSNGNLAQDVYLNSAMSNWVIKQQHKPNNKTISKLLEDVTSAQENRRHSNTDFRLRDLELRDYSAKEEKQTNTTDKEDLFGDGLVDNIAPSASSKTDDEVLF